MRVSDANKVDTMAFPIRRARCLGWRWQVGLLWDYYVAADSRPRHTVAHTPVSTHYPLLSGFCTPYK